MQNHESVRQPAIRFEGLEQRQFFSVAAGAFPFPPTVGEFGRPPAPIVFDGGSPPMRAPALGFSDVQVVVAATESTSAAAVVSGAFNGYPSPAAAVGGTGASMMSLLNRAVDGDVVSADEIHSAGFGALQSGGATSHLVVAASPDKTDSTEPSLPALPVGSVARPLSLFSSEPIRTDAGAAAVSSVTASLSAAGQEIACVVRLAWADVLHSDGFASLDRLASEAGRSIVEYADAEFAAALVLGVAGAAWWARQNGEDYTAETAVKKPTWIESIYPPA